ncbi:MAG: hypothetical protein ACJ784_21010 [Myxococcales bacterium]
MPDTKADVAAICASSAAASAQDLVFPSPPPPPEQQPSSPALWFDVLAERPAAVAGPFFGLGFGAAFVNRSIHPAARMTAGVEAFPGGPLPLQLGVDLLATWCSDRTEADCAGTQARTYVAGRIGLRL